MGTQGGSPRSLSRTMLIRRETFGRSTPCPLSHRSHKRPRRGVRGRTGRLPGEEAPGQRRNTWCPRQDSHLRHPLLEFDQRRWAARSRTPGCLLLLVNCGRLASVERFGVRLRRPSPGHGGCGPERGDRVQTGGFAKWTRRTSASALTGDVRGASQNAVVEAPLRSPVVARGHCASVRFCAFCAVRRRLPRPWLVRCLPGAQPWAGDRCYDLVANRPDLGKRASPGDTAVTLSGNVCDRGREGVRVRRGGQEATVTVLAMFLLIIGTILILLGTVLVVVGTVLILMGVALIAVGAFLLIRRVLRRRR